MNVDKTFVITVKEAHDRRKLFEERWKGFPFQWYKVDRHTNPIQGCFESHVGIIAEAKKAGLHRILIVEDDAFPKFPLDRIVEKVNNDMKYLDHNDPGWEYYMPGYTPVRCKKTPNPGIVKIECAFLSHFYIVNVPNVEIPKWNGFHVDAILFCPTKTGKSRIYGSRPVLVKQMTDSSYINQEHVNAQEILDRIGSENLVDISCHFNLIALVSVVICFLVFTPVIITITAFKNRIPTTFTVCMTLYALFLLSSLSVLLAI